MRDERLTRIALKERLYRRRFLVPNAVTLANMFCGFLACLYASQGKFEKAALAIGFAILLDGLDGRVARKLKATSKFGLEFDSFSDLTSFGIAPAILIYHWSLKPVADQFGVFICFIYAVCAASRLARFNIADQNMKSFTGLPTPGAAALVGALVNFAPAIGSSVAHAVVGSCVMVSLGFLMVSQVEFFSIKTVQMKSFGIFARILVAGSIALLWYNSGVGFLALAGVYVLSGPIQFVRSRYWPRPQEAESSPDGFHGASAPTSTGKAESTENKLTESNLN